MATHLNRCSRAVAVLLLGVACSSPALSQSVVTLRIPDGGRLPQAVLDDGGTLHLIYVVGDTQHGDLMYVTRAPGASSWSEPEQVNSAPGTVTGFGPVDGGQLALGKNNRLHVAWMRISPMAFFYTRSNEDGPGFEEQFGVASGDGVEAGPSVVADQDGNVYLFWHSGGGEDAGRTVYMVASRDEGFIFELARPINDTAEGACGCCSVAALSDDHRGDLSVLPGRTRQRGTWPAAADIPRRRPDLHGRAHPTVERRCLPGGDLNSEHRTVRDDGRVGDPGSSLLCARRPARGPCLPTGCGRRPPQESCGSGETTAARRCSPGATAPDSGAGARCTGASSIPTTTPPPCTVTGPTPCPRAAYRPCWSRRTARSW